jgi:hypothetical protein
MKLKSPTRRDSSNVRLSKNDPSEVRESKIQRRNLACVDEVLLLETQRSRLCCFLSVHNPWEIPPTTPKPAKLHPPKILKKKA